MSDISRIWSKNWAVRKRNLLVVEIDVAVCVAVDGQYCGDGVVEVADAFDLVSVVESGPSLNPVAVGGFGAFPVHDGPAGCAADRLRQAEGSTIEAN